MKVRSANMEEYRKFAGDFMATSWCEGNAELSCDASGQRNLKN
jgi:hypothetical protein